MTALSSTGAARGVHARRLTRISSAGAWSAGRARRYTAAAGIGVAARRSEMCPRAPVSECIYINACIYIITSASIYIYKTAAHGERSVVLNLLCFVCSRGPRHAKLPDLPAMIAGHLAIELRSTLTNRESATNGRPEQ